MMAKKKQEVIGIGLNDLLKKNLRIKEENCEKIIEELKKEIKSLKEKAKGNKKTLDKVYLDFDFSLSPEQLFKKGLEYDDKGDYPNAAYYYIRALRFDPDHRKAMLNLGAIYYEFGMNDRAKEIYKKVLNQYPDDEIAKENLKLLEEEQ